MELIIRELIGFFIFNKWILVFKVWKVFWKMEGYKIKDEFLFFFNFLFIYIFCLCIGIIFNKGKLRYFFIFFGVLKIFCLNFFVNWVNNIFSINFVNYFRVIFNNIFGEIIINLFFWVFSNFGGVINF